MWSSARPAVVLDGFYGLLREGGQLVLAVR
jgi:hypothetical protein